MELQSAARLPIDNNPVDLPGEANVLSVKKTSCRRKSFRYQKEALQVYPGFYIVLRSEKSVVVKKKKKLLEYSR